MVLYRYYKGIMDRKMEATIKGLGFRVLRYYIGVI